MSRNTTACILTIVLSLAITVVLAQSSDPFLRTLTDGKPLDRRGLAGFLGRTAAALEESREGVGFLAVAVEGVAPGKPYAERASQEMKERFGGYGRALDRFIEATDGLEQAPSSELRLFRVLTSGVKVCWLLESQINLADSYGANPARLNEIRTSASACGTFHHVIGHDKVTESVERALAEGREESDLARENRELREELQALEELVEDLLALEAD